MHGHGGASDGRIEIGARGHKSVACKCSACKRMQPVPALRPRRLPFFCEDRGGKGQWRSMSEASTNVSFKAMHMTFFDFVNASLDLAIGGERKQTPRCPSVAPRAPPWKNGAPKSGSRGKTSMDLNAKSRQKPIKGGRSLQPPPGFPYPYLIGAMLARL